MKYQTQYKVLKSILRKWLSTRTDVKSAHLVKKEGYNLLFVVIRNEVKYNADFEDELSDLDITIANDVDLDLLNMSSIGLPAVSTLKAKEFVENLYDEM